MIDMSATQPSGRSQPSWSTTTSSAELRHPRLSRLIERIGWIELLFTLLALAVYDFLAVFLGGVGITEARCPGGGCGPADSKFIPLPTQLQILHDARWIIPVLLALPLLVGLFLRRWLVLIALLQVAVCVFLLVRIDARAQLTDDRLHGRVPCWNKAFSATNCPWAGHN
jgi:hypothetical protein